MNSIRGSAFGMSGLPLRSSTCFVRLSFQVAGILPDVTSRQDRLSGVIICPTVWRGQRLTGKRHPLRCAVNSITATTTSITLAAAICCQVTCELPFFDLEPALHFEVNQDGNCGYRHQSDSEIGAVRTIGPRQARFMPKNPVIITSGRATVPQIVSTFMTSLVRLATAERYMSSAPESRSR